MIWLAGNILAGSFLLFIVLCILGAVVQAFYPDE